MICSAAIAHRYKTREQVRDIWPRGTSNAHMRDGGTPDGSDASTATTAACRSTSGCRPHRSPQSSESVS